MSLAYWILLIAAVLPYITVGIAKSRVPYDNANPRAMVYRGLAGRAHAAHENGFEVFPLFAVAILVASGGSAKAVIPLLDTLAIVWLVVRFLYIAAYLADRDRLRSLFWMIGLADALAILTMPAWHA